MKFPPRFLTKLSGKISCKVSFPRRMSPEMTDFHLIPSSADDGTLRGFFDTLKGRMPRHPPFRSYRNTVSVPALQQPAGA